MAGSVKISAKIEYACLAMAELAAAYGLSEPVPIRQMSEPHRIPPRFLVQILLQLKGAGLVKTTRGAAGGYQLARAPEAISLAEVISVMEGPGGRATAMEEGAATPMARVLHATWRELAEVERQRLEEISLAEVVARARKQAENMYYI